MDFPATGTPSVIELTRPPSEETAGIHPVPSGQPLDVPRRTARDFQSVDDAHFEPAFDRLSHASTSRRLATTAATRRPSARFLPACARGRVGRRRPSLELTSDRDAPTRPSAGLR